MTLFTSRQLLQLDIPGKATDSSYNLYIIYMNPQSSLFLTLLDLKADLSSLRLRKCKSDSNAFIIFWMESKCFSSPYKENMTRTNQKTEIDSWGIMLNRIRIYVLSRSHLYSIPTCSGQPWARHLKDCMSLPAAGRPGWGWGTLGPHDLARPWTGTVSPLSSHWSHSTGRKYSKVQVNKFKSCCNWKYLCS